MNSFSFYNEKERSELETFIRNKMKNPIERNKDKTSKLYNMKFEIPAEIFVPIYNDQ